MRRGFATLLTLGLLSGFLLSAVLGVMLAVGYPVAYLALVVVQRTPFSVFTLAGGWLIAVGLATFVGAAYRYPRGEPRERTVLDLLTDVYASPVDGARVELSGELIGRGTAGYRFSEDLMFQDDTGLMYLKYDSWLPLLGDFLFSVRQVPDLIGQEVTVEGWYFRGTASWLGLRRLVIPKRTFKRFVHLGSYAGAVITVVLGGVVLGAQFLL